MKGLIAAFVASLVAFNGDARAFDFPSGKIPSASGDYCFDEVYEYLNRKFDLQPNDVRIKRLGNFNWSIYVWTRLCHAPFEFTGRVSQPYECTVTQYGSRTYFVRHVHTTGDCLPYLPEMEHLP